MIDLFETTQINGMPLKNRFVRSATGEGMAADNGAATPDLIKLMADLAQGGVGLIISSHAYVSKEGQAGPWQLGVYADNLVPGLINRWRSGDHARSACLSDNKCFGPIMAGKGLFCVMDRKEQENA
ncbi:MAG: hypothetical protein QNK29_01825 [Desulfobacterales bacterium]|nr:hypothetical protein [Desulfobacterales bacterium]MDX2510748.1 hypothetical protein [Desulfobacterales bacterium]